MNIFVFNSMILSMNWSQRGMYRFIDEPTIACKHWSTSLNTSNNVLYNFHDYTYSTFLLKLYDQLINKKVKQLTLKDI